MIGTWLFDMGRQGSVGLLVGRRRVPGGRGGRGRRRLRPHAARAQLTIGTVHHLHPHARGADATTYTLFISIFHTFRLRCSTIYDLHTTSLLWCFVDGLRFCHTFVVAISIKRFDLPRDVGVTKTRSNQLMLCSVYCIIFAQWVCYHISLFVGYRSHSMLVYNEIYLHCRYVNKSNINVHITSHEWGHEVLTLAIPSVN